MNISIWRRSSAMALACAVSVFGQTKLDLRTQTKSVDFSAASSTKPAQLGTVLPSVCSQGQFFFLTTASAGQNVYGCSATNTWSLEGAAVPQVSLVPSELNKAGGFLTTDGTNPIWQILGGDVSGTPAALKVAGLQGRGISGVVPADGQLLKYNGTSFLWEPLSIGGDVSGAPATLKVGALLGRGLSTVIPVDGQMLKYNGNSGMWEPLTLSGDVTGAPGSLKVGALQGRALASTAPNDGQLLKYSVSALQWQPVTIGGDVSGTPTSLTVGALQGRALASTVPNDGQLLKYSASALQWQPVTIGGDVSGTPTALTVAALQGHPVANTAPGSGQFLAWNTSSSNWTPTAIQIPPNFNTTFSAANTVSITGTQHNLNTASLIITCFDNSSPGNLIEPNRVTIDPTAYNVTITFAQPQSGRCVLNGSGGLAGAAGGVTMSSQLGDLNVTQTSATVLTIGGGCSTATPCNVRFGSVNRTFTSPATATISGGTGTAYLYVMSDGTLNVGNSGLNISCSTGCQVQSGISQFPVNSVPVSSWNASSGSWAGGSDQRSFQSAKALLSGAGVLVTDNGVTSTLTTDTTLVPTYMTNTASLTFPAITNGACSAELTLGVQGAVSGDGIAAGWPPLPAGFFGMMRVSATGTVAVRLCNLSGATAGVGALSYRATVVGTPN